HITTVGAGLKPAPTTTNIELFDVVGQVVGTYRIRPENTETVIDISHLANGLYFLKIDGKMFKVVKQ
ncbi:MAG: T9SS type A sorting domain-containing protein, partial [Lentimicrobiaceae bacterium]|nr:T9SS type A sorting domain-containing protein [Lentimicrobiaceae bacterium]